jgi:hypothetical protein
MKVEPDYITLGGSQPSSLKGISSPYNFKETCNSIIDGKEIVTSQKSAQHIPPKIV